MPRVDSKHSIGSHFYHSQFTNSPYLPESTSSTSSSSSPPPLSPPNAKLGATVSSSSATPALKKKHVCPTCDRAFTTSGHLARHSRVHTGERNHKCPFPGCETRCSRQDNLQQHYRIHLSPGSRRSSTRTGGSRSTSAAKKAIVQQPIAPAEPPTPSTPAPLSPPPALEQARVYNHSSPPNSPPPLAQATLPATATLPLPNPRIDTASDRSSSSASPQTPYLSPGHNLVPITSQNQNYQVGNPHHYYRNHSYQDQQLSMQYVHSATISQSSGSPIAANSYSYPPSQHEGYSQQIQHPQQVQRHHSPVSLPSRHSISHISHPQHQHQHQHPYSQNSPASAGPASPASSHSVSSHTSGPPTPTYPVYHEESNSYHHGNAMIADQSSMHHGHHLNSQSHIQHHAYSSNVHNAARFDSPPPILAPIQDERAIRRDERTYNSASYIHHPQPLATDYTYHQSLGMGGWKGDSAMRKGVGALV